LHVLRLTLLKELEEWKVEENAMPLLEYMVIDRCEKLRKIPEGLKDITSLKKLKITGMPVDFEHRLRTKDLLEFKNTPIIESTTDILSIGKLFRFILIHNLTVKNTLYAEAILSETYF
jgi:hypothetical protein